MKLLFILGTRPEAVKMLPIVKECLNEFDVKICLTGQHEGLKEFFDSTTDLLELSLTRSENGLSGLVGNILKELDSNEEIRLWQPNLVLVHGDTTSSLCGALYAFYEGIKLCHVEAGLRTHDKMNPFPEESNRKIIDYLSDIHFPPTQINKHNLERELIRENVYVVGNSVVDALKKNITDQSVQGDYGLVTLHRRESWGKTIEDYIKEIVRFCIDNQQKIVFVANKNALLKEKIKSLIGQSHFIELLDPLNYKDFHHLVAGCRFILTDSGGVQEEAVILGKPLFVLRSATEREEIINNFCGLLVKPCDLYDRLTNFIQGNLLFNKSPYLYGDGSTALQTKEILKNILR